jgi:IS30 family transposase
MAHVVRVKHSAGHEHRESALGETNILPRKITPLLAGFYISMESRANNWSPQTPRFTLLQSRNYLSLHLVDKKNGGKLWKQLRCTNKQRRKRYKAYDSRGRLAGKRNIADRPAEDETRETQDS